MNLFAFGINHTTAPVAVRERVGFAPALVPRALKELVTCTDVAEAAILSTCNRTDLYCGLRGGRGESAIEWFEHYHRISAQEVRPHIYTHHAAAAVRHIIRVASGLDSLILGEPQILGQVKDAYQTAQQTGTAGRALGRLFQHAFSVAKQVRTDTAIGSSPVSVAFAAVTLAKQIFGDLSARTALLIGAGETIELAARHLARSGLTKLIVANRTVGNARRLAAEFGGYALSLSEIPLHLAEADIVISSTGAQEPVLTAQQTAQAVRARRHKPVLMVDIAVPRDIESEAGGLEDVYLYTVDDLHHVIEENRRGRLEAAKQAEQIIDAQVPRLMGWLEAQDVVPLIKALRVQASSTRDEVLLKALAQIEAGKSAEQALRFLANTLTNKLIHQPTSALKTAGADRDHNTVNAAKTLFKLEQIDD
ncbi:MAG: glutamyl-tRNA reductase [Gammaproteobacteria bacterium]|nr:glutamyl-tRNA reductase [Gammaproteobacteria bacterium]